MSGVTKQTKEQAARLKGQMQRVYISGLEGHHSLETGVAYHYRGHFIYAWPAGNPIEPVSFSTRKGIRVAGTVQEHAPVYDPRASDLIPEEHIAALHRSCVHHWETQQQQKEDQKKETAKALEEEAQQAEQAKNTDSIAVAASDAHEPSFSHLPSRTESSTVPSQPASRVASQISLVSLAAPSHRPTASSSNVPQISAVHAPPIRSVTAFAPQTLLSGPSYTPHDRAQYLAYSAPGSRHVSVTNTPYTSRPVSPTNVFSLRSSLRPSASTSQLHRLLANEGIRRSFSPLPEVAEDRASRVAAAILEEDIEANLSSAEYIDPDDIAAFIQTVSRPSSRPLSRSQSSDLLTTNDAMNNSLYLPGLGHVDATRPSSIMQALNSTTTREDKNSSLHLPGLGQVDMPREHHRGVTGEPSFPAFHENMSHGVDPDSTYRSHDKPIGTGRRRKASIALNEAYNAANPPIRPMMRVGQVENVVPVGHQPASYGVRQEVVKTRIPKCPIHYGDCDGVTTTNKHLTQQVRETRGFRDLYPTIKGEGKEERVMIDWARIRDEERAKLRM